MKPPTPHRTQRSVLLLGALYALAGCGGSTDGSAGDTGQAADAAQDTGATDRPAQDLADATPDAAPDTAAPPDAGMDAAEAPADTPDAAPDTAPRCARDPDCAGNPEGELCDLASGRCMRCNPADDRCPAERHCEAGSGRCAAGCRSDEGCPRSSGDGASGAMVCDTSLHRCVECARDEHCPAGTLCVGNVCTMGCSATRPCPGGLTCCAGACVDTQRSAAHCGVCDARCAPPNAAPACMNGRCVVGMCTAPFEDCDREVGNGCEVNTLTSAAHCGACGAACAPRANETASCAAGRCERACRAGSADCDGVATNGCETDLAADLAHCGRCRALCDPPNATGRCADGACGVGACREGFGDCDRNAANGCEADTRVTVSHCGRCGNACPAAPNAFPGCLGGACVLSCVAGFLDCNGAAGDGCEADLRADRRNCGTCGRACAVGPCVAGVCQCGNGVLDPGEACDEGARNSDAPGSLCRTDCTPCGACGSGRDGAFEPTASRTLRGGTYNFTRVTIPAGVTVTVTEDAPLRLLVQGAVVLDGTLDRSGSAGGAGGAGNRPPGEGGAGGGGGGRPGGRGGWFNASAEFIAALPGAGPGGGGAPPDSFRGAGAGGGGGGYSSPGARGANGTCCAARIEDGSYPGGPSGVGYGAPDLTSFQGGSGGGGGDFGRADNGTGGGGGGGGGAAMIVAASIRVGGRLVAHGGRGGDAAPGFDGGGGGGGSGGALWLRAPRVTITGAVEALGGEGGGTSVGSSCCLGGAGGRGSDGRVVIEAVELSGTTRPAAFRAPSLCRNPVCEP
ncbi:MAG: hypothetical protein HY909_13775 [Deltaproteobacteria bacterium]|nr:hypothetical protein [Deltaproteobacteria bacterium]